MAGLLGRGADEVQERLRDWRRPQLVCGTRVGRGLARRWGITSEGTLATACCRDCRSRTISAAEISGSGSVSVMHTMTGGGTSAMATKTSKPLGLHLAPAEAASTALQVGPTMAADAVRRCEHSTARPRRNGTSQAEYHTS
jgi:hypothetical protein